MIGVGWWSELFIFYGILTAIAVWEIRRFHNMSVAKEKRITTIEAKQAFMFEELDKLEQRIEKNSQDTRNALKKVR